tara:strand:- start:1447 stop:2118 length:672 start_codon:yes stop_codon:yes gene_type:complete
MAKKYDKDSAEELVINYLKKNKNFFIKYPNLTNELNFSLKEDILDGVINLEAYRYKKISQENIDLKNQMTKILLAGKNHITSQKKILKLSLKILNSKSVDKVINVILTDFKILLGCEVVNCFLTDNEIGIKFVNKIDSKIVKIYFKDKKITNLNQNLKGILLYFPNKSQIIKSYILLKVNIDDKILIIAMGSKDINKFSSDQQVDLVEYLIKIIEIKLKKELS